jgi:MFS family permease
MGVGAAMVFPSTLSLISNVFTERRERALAIGLWGAITGAAIALGPIVGGWLLQAFDWRSIFFAMTPVAAIAGVLVARYVPTSRNSAAPRTDRAGFALSTAMVSLLVYTIIEGPEPRLGERADARQLRADRSAGGGVRGLGAPHRPADARREPVPQPPVHRRQRLGRDLVLRALRVHLPRHPVLPVP